MSAVVDAVAGTVEEGRPGMTPRRVYFAFDYQRDVRRVKRFCKLPDIVSRSAGGFESASVWQEASREGDAAVLGLINDALMRTSVSVLCLGMRTAKGKYLDYEIKRSLELGNGLVAVTINRIPDRQGAIDPFAPVPPIIEASGYRVYEYSDRRALVEHIEEAYQLAQLDEGQRLELRPRSEAPAPPPEQRRLVREEVADGSVTIDGHSYPVKNWNSRGFLALARSCGRGEGQRTDIQFSVQLAERRLEFSCQAKVLRRDEEAGTLAALFVGMEKQARRVVAHHFGSHVAA